MHGQHTGLQSELARLEDAYTVLLARGGRAREQWRDSTAEAIEDEYLRPLGQLVQNAIPAVGQISDQLSRSVRACSEPRDAF